MSKYNAVVYPYQRAFTPFISQMPKEPSSYCGIKALVSPRGYPYAGKDAGCVDLRDDTGFIVSDDYMEVLEQSDSLLIPEGKYSEALYSDIIKKAIVTAQKGKHILCAMTLKKGDDENLLRGICSLHNVDFIYAQQIGKDNIEKAKGKIAEKKNSRLHRAEASVVFIGSLFESDTSKKDITLILKEYFSQLGHKVSVVMEPGYSQIIGYHGTDELFATGSENVADGITSINRYFEGLEKLEHPDVVLVHIPGGLMKFDDNVHNSYGIYAYMLSQAVTPDCFVCSFPYENYKAEAPKIYSDFIESRFGCPMTCMHISNVLYDTGSIFETGKLDVTFVALGDVYSLINEQMTDDEILVVNALEAKGREEMCEKIKDTLISYNDVTSL